VHADTENI